jgi:hypothetical protein
MSRLEAKLVIKDKVELGRLISSLELDKVFRVEGGMEGRKEEGRKKERKKERKKKRKILRSGDFHCLFNNKVITNLVI